MTRAHCNFRQRDVTAALRAVAAAGMAVACVEIDRTGKIRITTASEIDNKRRAGGDNEWDNHSQ